MSCMVIDGVLIGPDCTQCDSYTKLVELEQRIYVLQIFHDDDCAELLRRSRHGKET